MALQQTDNVSDVNINEDTSKNNAANIQNGTDVARHTGSIHHPSQQAQQQIHNTRPTIHQQQHPQQNSSNINEKFSTTKSPPIQTGGMMSLGGSPNNGGEPHSHSYSAETSTGAHYGQTQPSNQHIVGDNLNQKDDPYGQQSVTMGSHPSYGRYHPNDPSNPSESYRYGHSSMQPGKPPGIMTPNRPPQRYVPGQQIQGPTPTLNSLLQSHPPPPQQRYPNNYDSQQQTGPQQPQSYGSQGWSVPPRPYSPQMGQTYRTPSPANTPRNQPGYPMAPGQVGSYTSSPQQAVATHSTGPTPTTSQYSPYPQRYSTPPGSVAGSNHRAQYSQQYPDVNRSWAGPGSSSPAVSPGPGVHPNAPASPHQMQHAGPPPNSPGHVPCGSPQPPQASPSPHQEMVGQNSNDSSSGGGICTAGSVPPGTPQQAMRPTPSPTGSSGSRSMSPAVAQQNISMPVRLLNNQLTPTSVGMLSSHISNVGNMSMQQHSNIMQAQNQQQSLQLTSEPVLGQLAARSSNINTSQVSQQSQITSSQQQSVQVSGNITTQSAYQPQLSPQSNIHNYKMGSGQGQPNPQNISPYTTPPPPPSSQQYQQGNYAPRPQYPSGYGSNPNTGQLPPTNAMSPASNQYVGRSMPNQGPGSHPQFPPYQQGWSTASPPTASGLMPNHGQGKNSPLPSQTAMGSPRPLNYLKQHLQHKGGFAGSPSPTPPQNYGNGSSMHPPMAPPHHMGPPHGPSSMGPPSSAPQNTSSPQPPSSNNPPPGCSNTLDTNTMVDHNNVSQDNSGSSSSTMSSHPVTSVVTTGPDGAPLDEASQQSTLSNASAASGEDPQCLTPKSRKNDPYNHGHLAPPNASPGQPHGNEDFEMHSPSNWPRAAASPVFNHVPQESYRASTKKSDSLCKLYDMDENPDRRGWLDKLLTFMEERRTPITACPTISKQPLDLYRLYIYVKERGGFVEVCKVTKSKTWKDIAGLLGIGASSSAAYTLRKHYTKNLLAFECHFDRGGVDPLPIIQQVEAGSKKKTTKAASVPSPAGSSNSQDSFPSSVSANVSMDGYPGYTTGSYAANAQADFSTAPQIQRPPSQNNAQSSHQGVPYQGQPNFNQYGTEQYNPAGPPGQYSQNQSQFPPPNRTMFTPYGSENDTGGNSANNFPPYGPARPYNQPPVGNSQPASAVATSTSSPSTPSTYPPQPPSQQDYYRQQEQNSQPRRHPDFVKESQSYPGYAQRPQIYPGWQNNPAAQYRNQYPSQQAQQQWNSPRPSIPTQPQPNQQQPQPGNQWEHRYPPQAQQPYQPNTPPPSQWNTLGNTGQSPNSNSPLRPTHRGPSGNGKQPPFNMPPPPQIGAGGNKSFVQQPAQQSPAGFISGGQIQKRDIIFPPDSIEATTPILYRRKRLAKSDVCPIDPWRIFMSLRSGLLSESTWALDILNVLLFDDSAVQYFGLSHLPGLLNLLLEHFQKSLLEMFVNKNKENPIEFNCQGILENDKNNEDIDLGQIVSIPNSDERVLILSTTQNFTLVTRKGIPVRIQNAEDDIFVSETLKKWDYESNKNYQLGTPNCSDPWTYGHNDRFPHNGIIDVFKSEIVDIPFARYLKPKMNKLQKNIDEHQHFDNNNRETSTKTDDLRSVINKRPYIVPTNSEEIKRKKSNDENWNENSLAIKTEINGNTSKVKQQLIDSDCRQVDMEIEPRNMSSSSSSSINICVSANRLKTTSLLTDNDSNEQIIEDNRKTIFDPKITVKDPATILRRRRMSEYEDECYTRDEASLYLVNDSQDILARRCICLSNIFRNLTFVPGNEVILARSSTFLALLGNLLLLNHEHVLRTHKNRNYDREEDTDFGDSCSSLQGEKEWWWEYLIQIRENMLVAVANIAGHLELSKYEEIITRPVLDGLLHWAVCPSAHGQDPFPSCGPITVLSPQRLALEALCKLCVTDANVDLVIATPPFSRLEKLCSVLTRHLCRNEDQVLREFSVNLLHYLAAADSAMSRTVALQSPCISYLVAFIEQAEQTALGVANQHGINYLRENPDSMGTSLDMLRRAAGTLLHLSKHPDNRPLFMQQEQRLLGLVMSHILDQQVALIISRVLFQVSRGCGPMTSIEYKSQLKQKKNSSSAERILTSLQTINIIRNTDKSINIQNEHQSIDVPTSDLIVNDTTSTDLPVVKSDNDSQESIKTRIDSNKKDISTASINIDKLINSSETSSNASNSSNSSSTSNNNDNTNKNLSTSITNPTAAVA